jgi:hypothetical protein
LLTPSAKTAMLAKRAVCDLRIELAALDQCVAASSESLVLAGVYAGDVVREEHSAKVCEFGWAVPEGMKHSSPVAGSQRDVVMQVVDGMAEVERQ